MTRFILVATLVAAPLEAANRYAAQLRARPAGEQARILGVIVRSAGERCASVRKIEYIGEAAGTASWRVACGTGRFLVGVEADSSTRIVDCSIFRRMGRRDCP